MKRVEVGSPDEAERRYRPEEIREALYALSDDDMRRIEKIARHFAPRSGMSIEDLRQETFLRVLASRSCKVGTSMISFLAGTMKSIASETPRARKKAREEAGMELVFTANYGEDGVPEPAADGPDPEEEALSRTIHAPILERVSQCISNDFELQLLVEGLFDGKRGKELEELLTTDAKGLAAAKKRLSRKLEIEFPAGAPL
jgi:DNA-directed RNA polymerase specialized sigma24 family protein